MSSSIKTVGFIGTGLMGLPIAKKVQELYAKTVKSGRANLDHSALYLFIKALSR